MSTGTAQQPSRRIVIATFGSLGDLHPFLALALELQTRGHIVTVATAIGFADRVAALGLTFVPVGPSLSPDEPDVIHRIVRTARGPEYLFRRVFFPQLPELYAQLGSLTANADMLLASEVIFAAPILAETTGIPWVSVLLSPISFLSAHDPSIPPVGIPALRSLPVVAHRIMLKGLRLVTRHWTAPLQSFRRSLGLAPSPDALLRGKLSAPLILAMFSRHFAQPQPDWPRQTVQTGFAFFDQRTLGAVGASVLPVPLAAVPPGSAADATERLQAFLAGGTLPVVFTLGSSAVHAAEDFFHISAITAYRLRVRAILISPRPDVALLASTSILVIPYADYRTLFPHAAAIVHQAGIGTMGEVLRAGVPSLIVPFGFDQPDNAARAVRLGVAISLPRRKYNRRHAYYALHRLLRDDGLRERAAAMGEHIRAENGTCAAVNAIEAFLGTMGTSAQGKTAIGPSSPKQ